jgi:hypothetical protein
MTLPPRLGPSKQSVAGLSAIMLLGLGSGCGTTKVTGTARTGTEQLLLTNAWDKALMRVDFRPLTGVPVFLDTTNVTAVDQGWVVSSLREAMLTQGVLIREKKEQAQFVIEARVGAYGTDDDSMLVGIAQTTIPPTVTGIPTGTIPKLPLIERSRQSAVAKLALFAYDRASGQLVWSSGTVLDKADTKNVFVGGFGPIKSGSLQNGAEVAGIEIPLPGAPNQPSPGNGTSTNSPTSGPRMTKPYNPPGMATPSNLSDLESFQP